MLKWLFGFKECYIVQHMDKDQVKIRLNDNCLMVVYKSLLYNNKHSKQEIDDQYFLLLKKYR